MNPLDHVEELEKFRERDKDIAGFRDSLRGAHIARQQIEPSLRRIREMGKSLCREIYRRDRCIWMVLAATAARVPVVLFGPPGTAKSMIVRRMAELCGHRAGTGVYFEYLLSPHTMPEELFGPPDIKDLEEGRFRRRTERMLPEASLVFLDEVFHGGSHILSAG